MTHLLAFIGISALVIVTPGPDTALTIRNTLGGGRRCGVMTALGIAIGVAVWSLAASVGLAAVLRASGPAFLAVKIAGAAYLVFLGVQALLSALGRHGGNRLSLIAPARVTPSLALRQGLISNLGNPKIAVFCTSLLPQFVGGGSVFLGLLALGFVFCAINLCWLSSYAVAVAKTHRLLTRPHIRRALDGIAGTVLIAFGIRLATERR